MARLLAGGGRCGAGLSIVNGLRGAGDRLARMSAERLVLGLCAAVLLLLQGCAAGGVATSGVPVLLAGAAMAVNPDYAPLDKEVTNQALFLHPAPQVYATLLATIERDGRRVVEANPLALTIRVSYPFSLAANHWGGVLTVACEAHDAQTLLRIVGSGRDGIALVRPIGDAIIRDLAAALAAQGAPA
jgi:hypothetical protein